ncbi:pilus assembly protein PilM [Burkholderia sp. Ac-20379]|nr:pilus assembly protein PilM [Burkholderia sp. Ac-20379]MBN3728123.1 pilus assembly protein PilM [Burkholderia sp. Ac-20379]
MAGRRVAAGIDVGRDAVRVAFVSRRRNTPTIEALEVQPYAQPCDLAGRDWSCVTQALGAIVERTAARLPVRGMSAVMALPPCEVAMSSLDPRIAAQGPVARAVHAEAERVTGLPSEALSIDWCVNDILYPGRLLVASAERVRIELRVEAASAAGFLLTGIDGEPYAALRAIRQVACGEIAPAQAYAALWIGEGSVDAWRVEGLAVTAHLRMPSPEYTDWVDLLRDLASRGELHYAYVGGAGEPRAIDGAPPPECATIGDLLGCLVLPFDCAVYCATGERHAVPPGGAGGRFAVAFGLGLRGVCE